MLVLARGIKSRAGECEINCEEGSLNDECEHLGSLRRAGASDVSCTLCISGTCAKNWPHKSVFPEECIKKQTDHIMLNCFCCREEDMVKISLNLSCLLLQHDDVSSESKT